jgi:hypothetical protein
MVTVVVVLNQTGILTSLGCDCVQYQLIVLYLPIEVDNSGWHVEAK